MSLPPVIPDTWQFSGPWFGCYRLIDHRDMGEPFIAYSDLTCPICGYDHAVHMSRIQTLYPLCYWCPACEAVYQWYVAFCPDCDKGTIWNKGCPDGKVSCSLCDEVYDQDFMEEWSENPNLHNDIEQEEEGGIPY